MPATADLQAIENSLDEIAEEVYVTDLSGDTATIVVRTRVSGEGAAERAASDLRLKIAERLAEEAT